MIKLSVHPAVEGVGAEGSNADQNHFHLKGCFNSWSHKSLARFTGPGSQSLDICEK